MRDRSFGDKKSVAAWGWALSNRQGGMATVGYLWTDTRYQQGSRAEVQKCRKPEGQKGAMGNKMPESRKEQPKMTNQKLSSPPTAATDTNKNKKKEQANKRSRCGELAPPSCLLLLSGRHQLLHGPSPTTLREEATTPSSAAKRA